MEAIQATDTGVLLRIRVQPRRSVERLDGLHGNQIRLRLTASPIAGAANTACIAFLAKILKVRRSQVRIQAGEKSRNKLIHVAGLTPAEVIATLGIVLP